MIRGKDNRQGVLIFFVSDALGELEVNAYLELLLSLTYYAAPQNILQVSGVKFH